MIRLGGGNEEFAEVIRRISEERTSGAEAHLNFRT
jgi:hypothetical protein